MTLFFKAILYAGLAGTSAMTLFSYLVSAKRKRQYKEPELLGGLIQGILPSIDKKKAVMTGWLIHYLVGTAFTFVYAFLLRGRPVKNRYLSAIAYGSLCGCTGILIWKTAFALRPSLKPASGKNYFKHLLLAHLLFGLGMSETYNHRVRRPVIKDKQPAPAGI